MGVQRGWGRGSAAASSECLEERHPLPPSHHPHTAPILSPSISIFHSVLSDHHGWVSDAALSLDGGRAVTASGDGAALLWDTTSGACVRRLEGHSGEVRLICTAY